MSETERDVIISAVSAAPCMWQRESLATVESMQAKHSWGYGSAIIHLTIRCIYTMIRNCRMGRLGNVPVNGLDPCDCVIFPLPILTFDRWISAQIGFWSLSEFIRQHCRISGTVYRLQDFHFKASHLLQFPVTINQNCSCVSLFETSDCHSDERERHS